MHPRVMTQLNFGGVETEAVVLAATGSQRKSAWQIRLAAHLRTYLVLSPTRSAEKLKPRVGQPSPAGLNAGDLDVHVTLQSRFSSQRLWSIGHGNASRFIHCLARPR